MISGSTTSVYISEKKRKTSQKEDRNIKRNIQQFSQISSKEIKNLLRLDISMPTIKRRAIESEVWLASVS